MNHYHYVIFDVDGTLLDTTEGIQLAVSKTIMMENLRPLSKEELLTFIGPPIQESFRRFYELSDARIQELATSFRKNYSGEYLLRAREYDGLCSVCRQMKEMGVKMAVATFKRQDYAEKIVKFFPSGKYMEFVFGADHENKLKKADIITLAKNSLGVSKEDAVLMIGDSSYDAIGAEKLGIDFLGVTYGFGFKTEKDVMQYKSIGCVNKPMEILLYI